MKKVLLIVALTIAFTLSSEAITNPYLLASVNKNATFPNGNGDEKVATWLNGLITTYNLANNPDLPGGVGNKMDADASLSNAQGGSGGQNPTNAKLTLSGSDLLYNYLVLHWGGPNGGTIQAYYLAQPFPSTTYAFEGPTKHGISFARLYAPTNPGPGPGPKPMPDAGSTLALLGLAVGALGIARKKLAK